MLEMSIDKPAAPFHGPSGQRGSDKDTLGLPSNQRLFAMPISPLNSGWLLHPVEQEQKQLVLGFRLKIGSKIEMLP